MHHLKKIQVLQMAAELCQVYFQHPSFPPRQEAKKTNDLAPSIFFFKHVRCLHWSVTGYLFLCHFPRIHRNILEASNFVKHVWAKARFTHYTEPYYDLVGSDLPCCVKYVNSAKVLAQANPFYQWLENSGSWSLYFFRFPRLRDTGIEEIDSCSTSDFQPSTF